MSSDYKRRRLKTIPTAAGGEEVDRFSALPDEIIHKILALLDSPKKAAKAIVLSRRWAKLWRSYPILEFRDTQFGPKQSAKRFAAAAAEKLGRSSDGSSIAMEAVRIKFLEPRADWDPQFCSALLDEILELAAERSPPPQEIDIAAEFDGEVDKIERHRGFDGSRAYTIPQGLLLPKSNSNSGHQFRLKVLKLKHCNLDQYKDISVDILNNNPFVRLGSSLRELELSYVSFPGDRILNSIIAGASLLQKLTLWKILGIRRLQVRNLPNLKVLKFKFCLVEDLEITGVHSLEQLLISGAPLGGDFVVSSMPNLKSLYIHSTFKLIEHKFDELISKSPSLKSLSCGGLENIDKLKIINIDKLREFDLAYWMESQVIEMEAPKLRRFSYSGSMNVFITVLRKIGSYYREVGHSLDVIYRHFEPHGDNVYILRKFLAQLPQFWFNLTLEFTFYSKDHAYCWKKVRQELPISKVEHVKIPWSVTKSLYMDNLFDGLFQNFHPNYLSFTSLPFPMLDDHILASEYVCKRFMERDSGNQGGSTTYKYWYLQMKDMKVIKRVRIGGIKVEDGDEVMEISPKICSSLADSALVEMGLNSVEVVVL